MLLSQARTRVRTLADDTESVRWTDDEIDDVLGSALEEIIINAVSSGINLFEVTETFTVNGDGYVSLSSENPIKIIDVQQVAGNSRFKISPSRRKFMSSTVPGLAGITLEVTYVPRPVFPATALDAFVYGSNFSSSSKVIDNLICVVAASDLKITEGELNDGLERRKQELYLSLANTCLIPGSYVQPFSSSFSNRRGGGYKWIFQDGFKLVLITDRGA